MNVLWVVNIPLEEAVILMNEKPSPFGGWLINASKDLSNRKNVKLSVAFPKQGISDVTVIKGERITYYVFPLLAIEKRIEDKSLLAAIIKMVNPNIVHIFGTEYPHSLAFAELCNKQKIEHVVSIQGLISVCSKHYLANLPYHITKKYTFRDFIRQENLIQQQKKFEKRGLIEIETLKKSKHIIGRTTWDRACTSQINPNTKYYFCNETLRQEFYHDTWNATTCEKHSIFTSQAAYPLKGVHFVLEAMPIILKNYPDTKLYIAGNNFIKSKNLKDKIRISAYGKYIKSLIDKNNLQNSVFFTGILNVEEMAERFLNSNVFVCPSSIENSPNSLGEAMILGVPSVASNVGGIPDMLEHKREGFLYQSDAPYMMAHYIMEIFSKESIATNLSKNARIKALKTHDREDNGNKLVEIYTEILGNRGGK